MARLSYRVSSGQAGLLIEPCLHVKLKQEREDRKARRALGRVNPNRNQKRSLHRGGEHGQKAQW